MDPGIEEDTDKKRKLHEDTYDKTSEHHIEKRPKKDHSDTNANNCRDKRPREDSSEVNSVF